MRRCTWCGQQIQMVPLRGYGAYWCAVGISPAGPGAAICRPHEMATENNEPVETSDDHEPEPWDLPPRLDDRVDLERWLEA